MTAILRLFYLFGSLGHGQALSFKLKFLKLFVGEKELCLILSKK